MFLSSRGRPRYVISYRQAEPDSHRADNLQVADNPDGKSAHDAQGLMAYQPASCHALTSRISQKEESFSATAASRTRLWLASGWGCRGRRLSRGREKVEQVATAAGRLCAPTQQTGGQNAGGRARNQFSISPASNRAPDRQC